MTGTFDGNAEDFLSMDVEVAARAVQVEDALTAAM